MFERVLKLIKDSYNKGPIPVKPGDKPKYDNMAIHMDSIEIIDEGFDINGLPTLEVEWKGYVYKTYPEDPSKEPVKSNYISEAFSLPVPTDAGSFGSKQNINIAQENTRVRFRPLGLTIGRKSFEPQININIRSEEKDKNPIVVLYLQGDKEPLIFDTVELLKVFNLTEYNDILSTYYGSKLPDYEVAQIINNAGLKDIEFTEETITTLSIHTGKLYKSNYLDQEKLKDILDIYSDRTKVLERLGQKTPLDFNYLTFDGAMESYLSQKRSGVGVSGGNYINTAYGMTMDRYCKDRYFDSSKQEFTPETNSFFPTYLTKYFYKFTKDTESDLTTSQQAMDTNPAARVAQRDKILFEIWQGGEYKKVGIIPEKFVGIVDPTFTADSNQVNIKNLLAKDVIIDQLNNTMTIKVLTKKFKEVEIPINEYMKSKVLSSDAVDYDRKQILKKDSYDVYFLGKYIKVTDINEVDYIRTRNGVLSRICSMMPFINRNSSMRVMLGVHFC